MRTIIKRYEKEQADKREHANDAQQLFTRLQQENVWVRFQLDKDGRIVRIAWALEDQKKNALRYYPIIIQDNTFGTNA